LLEPFLSAGVLAPALLGKLTNADASAELLPAIAAGERIVVVAHQEPQARGELNSIVTRAEKSGDGYILHGKKSVIAHAPVAHEFLVTARTSGTTNDSAGVRIFRLPNDARGLAINSYRTLDGQLAADLDFDRVHVSAANLVAEESDAFACMEAAHHLALSALCAEAVGIMKAVNAATLEYTKNRKQFGQPISRFQVLQHRMVDMFIQAEQATSMSYLAAIKCQDADVIERRRARAAAKVFIGQAGRFIGQQAIQLHGGMGMTDEMAIGHYFKRATMIESQFGSVDHHLARYEFLSLGKAA
jgi:alkylation response protein AidB-like acyl-CoA dehydrogenase